MYNLKFVEQKCDATNWGINSFSNPLVETQIHFYFLNAWAAQTAQTEEFLFPNVAYRPTVYRTEDASIQFINLGGGDSQITWQFTF